MNLARILRLGWGVTLVCFPAGPLELVGARDDGRARVVTRVLGARHLLFTPVMGTPDNRAPGADSPTHSPARHHDEKTMHAIRM